MRSSPINGKSNKGFTEMKSPSLIKGDVKAENPLAFEQRVITKHVKKRCIQIVDGDANICVKRADANTQPVFVKF